MGSKNEKNAEQNIHSEHRERMRKRFLRDGFDGFEQHNMLEMLLFHTIPRADTNEPAHRLLQEFHSLSGVLNASYEDILRVDGIGPKSAMLIKICGAMIRPYMADLSNDVQSLDTTEQTVAYIRPKFIGLKNETVYLIGLDAKRKIIYCGMICEGTLDNVAIYVRNVMQKVMEIGASSIILAHNHPSGFAIPSRADVAATLALREALRHIQVEVLDHIIVCPEDSVSIMSSGYIEASKKI